MCIRSRALSAAVVLMIVTVAGGRAQAQTSAEPEAKFEPEPDNKTIEPPQPGAPPPRDRPKRRPPLAEQPAPPPPAYERAGDGGVAVELSAGGVASGSFQGGILLGLGMRGFVFGVFMDAWQSTTILSSDPPNVANSVGSSTRVGIAARVPIARTSEGRVSLFAAGDLAITSLYTVVNATSSPHAEGITWSLGPGLRFWLNDHLSLAYLTRVRWTRLEGSPAALPEVPDDWLTSTVSAHYTQLEGAFQFLCIF
jgi:hypothetical protein